MKKIINMFRSLTFSLIIVYIIHLNRCGTLKRKKQVFHFTNDQIPKRDKIKITIQVIFFLHFQKKDQVIRSTGTNGMPPDI